MEFLNEKRVIYTLIIIFLIFAFIVLSFLSHLASVAMDARERNNKIEEFFPKVKNGSSAIIFSKIFAFNTPDIIFVGSFYF